ncbi:MAG: bifunctional folylpolyglutamate synthase/dihydrofolate synthase, partial [Acidimicrobiia bacterium]|nr:bifunctional folylpolyglutamate synthase/dihydrofolate synthase [Acidimicrobiia bacterium]
GGRAVDDLAVAEAATIATPGRMEILDTAPLVMVDGAHNQPAAQALAAALQREFPSTEWTLVFGAMVDKEVDSMLAALAPHVGSLFAVAADAPRAMPVDKLVELANGRGIGASGYDSVAAGVQAAVDSAGANGAVLVTGSLYVAGEARLSLIDRR